MRTRKLLWAGIAAGLALPLAGQAQDSGLASGIGGLQAVLDQLYTSMLPMCSQLIGLGQGLAGLGALTYIGIRVGRHIANAEGVDVFSLLRPIAIGIAILLFPYLIGLLNGVLTPTVTETGQMLGNANASIATLLDQKEQALKNTADYQLYVGPDGGGNEALLELYNGNQSTDPVTMLTNAFSFQLSRAYYNMKNSVKVWLSEILQILYEAAALCINTVRTFQLLVLAILGPLVLALSVFDGFQHTLRAWLARYINVFLWLPVANIFGAVIANIQVQMIQLDIQQIQANGQTYFSATDAGYLVFLIMGIVGYFTVPTIAGYIVSVGGGGALTGKMTAMAGGAVQQVTTVASTAAGAPGALAGGLSGGGPGGRSSWASKAGRAYGKAVYQRNKISGGEKSSDDV